jgi:pimeloyl-ACP methyl ester carboxylesterase
MQTVQSADGTTIAFDRTGDGPPLLLVDGALVDRSAVSSLAAALAGKFTTYAYDRRGRGDSGDTSPHAVEREIEDLDALITAAGGSALVLGHSSGAVLALRAAAQGLPISRLVVYEPPFVAGDTRPRLTVDLEERVRALVASGVRIGPINEPSAAQQMARATGVGRRMTSRVRPPRPRACRSLACRRACSYEWIEPRGRKSTAHAGMPAVPRRYHASEASMRPPGTKS